jgi:hypothetical protein
MRGGGAVKWPLLAAILAPLALGGWDGTALANSDEACKARFKEQVGACANEAIADPARDASDFSFWKACQAKYEPDLEDCLDGAGTSGSSVSPPPTPECGEAKTAIDWVFADVGATKTFARHRQSGKSPLDSVIGAQGHNPHAQQMLRDCPSWAANYLMATYRDPVDGLTPGPDDDPDAQPSSCSAPPAGLCSNGCEISCSKGRAALCEPGITWNFQCWRGPKCVCIEP